MTFQRTLNCLVSCALASTFGCATLKVPEAELVTGQSRYESATITYRTSPGAAAVPAATGDRPTTLAIRYPHPAGRSGYARIELITQANQPGSGRSSKWMPLWLDEARRFAHETLPGVSLADGIDEALGLDLPAGDLDRVLTRLAQPHHPCAAGAQLEGTVNGARLAPHTIRLAELDELILRVRREGSVISCTDRCRDSLVALQNQPSANVPQGTPGPVGVVLQASYAAPTITRLPPVASPPGGGQH